MLATEERSGFYGRGSKCALKGKEQARARPVQCVVARSHNRSDKVLNIKGFPKCIQRPGEKCGLEIGLHIGAKVPGNIVIPNEKLRGNLDKMFPLYRSVDPEKLNPVTNLACVSEMTGLS